MQLREWNARLHGLVVFRALLGDPVVAKLAALTDRLEAADDSIAPLCDAVAAFEAALFAHSLHRMYTMYAARQNWACSVISLNETELGGVKEITFSIEGPGVYSRLKFESGVHRVQRVPETETQGRIHTSAPPAQAASTSTKRRPPSG